MSVVIGRISLALALVAFACGTAQPNPCVGVIDTCLRVDVSSADFSEVDQLELDVLYGDFHGTATTQRGGGVVSLPLVTAVVIDNPEQGQHVGIVAAGKLGGTVLGTGAASLEIDLTNEQGITIRLTLPPSCEPSGHYCGGDKLTGDPETLYECNGGGVPLARGRCEFGCAISPDDDDFCRGGPQVCQLTGLYCGGDKVNGDPQTLYRCDEIGGSRVGVPVEVCAAGCIVSPPGSDDECR